MIIVKQTINTKYI